METKVTIVTTISDNCQCTVIAGILAELARNEMDYHAKYEPESERVDAALSQEGMSDGR